MVKTLEDFFSTLHRFEGPQREKIEQAAHRAEQLHRGQKRASGEPYFVHPLQVAEILMGLGQDHETIAAALLHDVLEDTSMTKYELRQEFGHQVENLVDGVTKIEVVKAKTKSQAEAETIRKMLFAMVKDIRVILIKLADKLHNMRTLKFKAPQRQVEIAQECLDIYAPLAGRLGIAWLKDELEDLSLKHMRPNIYQSIKEYVSTKRGERSDYLKRVEDAIYAAAAEERLKVSVEVRAKHFYSIFQKMKLQNKSLDEIYDLLGVRIICDTAAESYAILGVVHKLWIPIEGRFKDYIAMPKSNGYQSLHTTVLCFEGKLIEIQIRTHKMHQTAMYGIAAHWLYKEGKSIHRLNQQELSIITQLRDASLTKLTTGDFLDEMKKSLLKDSIYVFTPKGDVFELPKGSTALDFAYHVHTEVGNQTTGAKADGSIIGLREPLKNSQMIEILTSANAHPKVDWLRFVKTGRARSKIKAWLHKHDESLIINQNVVVRHRPGDKKGQEDSAENKAKGKKAQQAGETKKAQAKGPDNKYNPDKMVIRSGSMKNMMIRFATCCAPVPGDDIVGYVSRGRGIIVHRTDCKNLGGIPDIDQRGMEVTWESETPLPVYRYRIWARRTADLFSELERCLHKIKGNLVEGRIDHREEDKVEGIFAFEVPAKEDQESLAKRLRSIDSVHSVLLIEQIHH